MNSKTVLIINASDRHDEAIELQIWLVTQGYVAVTLANEILCGPLDIDRSVRSSGAQIIIASPGLDLDIVANTAARLALGLNRAVAVRFYMRDVNSWLGYTSLFPQGTANGSNKFILEMIGLNLLQSN